MKPETINKSVLLGLVLGISLLFLFMIGHFLTAIIMAGLVAGMSQPLYHWLVNATGGRRYLASLGTLVLLLTVILIPLAVLTAVFVGQAINVGQSVVPQVVGFLREPGAVSNWLNQLPFWDQLLPYEDDLRKSAAESIETAGKLLVSSLSSIAISTAELLFALVVFIYTLFFFLADGHKVVRAALYYLPLEDSDERLMLDKFTSVTRAMVKGTLVIGILQGGLAGAALAVAGVDNALFWGTVMAVLSIIPGIGSALVWVPASVFLIFQGQVAAGVGVILFCALVVGSIDNLLRPILVGKDTNMHELMIFFGTIGGLLTFGMSGLLIGPLIASLFLTLWEIYGTAFKDILPAVGGEHPPGSPAEEHPILSEADQQQLRLGQSRAKGSESET